MLEKLEDWFSNAYSWDKEWRDKAKTWFSYYQGEQWTSVEETALIERGQAVTTYNHIAPAIDAVVGGERQNRPDIKMAARTFDDEKIAQVKTDLYKYIEYSTKTDDHLDMFVLDACVAGRAWMHIYPKMDGEKFEDLEHNYVDYRDMFIDQYSKKDDLSDARYLHHAVFVDEDMLEEQFPKYKSEEASQGSTLSFESSSEEELYYEKGDRARPRIINTWFRNSKNEVVTIIWIKGQILYKSEKPYSLNDFPYVQVTVKRDLENMPYGFVKSMISAQDEVNKRHSKALHYLNARQVLAEENAFVNWAEAEKTLAKPDGITKLEDNALAEGRVQLVDNAQLAQTHIQMMEHAKSQVLALAGINASFIGQSSEYESAKKSQVQSSGAANVLVPFFNKIRSGRHRLASLTMRMVPDFYTDARMIRILQPTGEYAFMPVNEVQLMDDDTLAKINDMTVDDVDVIIEDAPAGLQDRQEQFNQLLGIQGQTGRPVPMEILLRYSDLKDKYQLTEELKAYYDMETQMQQMQQQMEQMQQEMGKKEGQVQNLEAQLFQSNMGRQVDKEVGKAKDQIKQETNMIVGEKPRE